MKKNIFAAVILSAVMASPAFAEGFYLGADLGRSNASVDVQNTSFDNHDTAWGVHGGYKFSPFLAAEIGYRDFGKFDETYANTANVSLKAHAVEASVIGSYPFNESFNVYGRLGVASVKATADLNARGRNYFHDEQTETKAVFGIGAQYAINKNFSLRTEYTQYSEIEDVKLSSFTIGANYSF